MGISVVVPAYNAEKTISQCVESILAQEGEFELIVVDNGSTDRTAEILGNYPGINMLTEKNRGASRARNSGILAARYRKIAFIDSDCVAEPGWLIQLDKNLAKTRCAAGRIEPLGKDLLSRFSGEFRHSQEKYVTAKPCFAATANAAFWKHDLEKAGLFNPDMAYCEDIEICQRMGLEPGDITYSSGAVVKHNYKNSVVGLLRASSNHGYYHQRLSRDRSFASVGRLSYLGAVRKYGPSFCFLKGVQDIGFAYGFYIKSRLESKD